MGERKHRKDNSKLKELIAEYGIKTMDDVHDFVKMLTAETIQTALDAELEKTNLVTASTTIKTSRLAIHAMVTQ